MTGDGTTESRRAIEALRAGVPNRDAVRILGNSQPALEARFKDQLKATRDGLLSGVAAPGMLVTGDFGSGKSHLLEHFQHVALEQNFVCSKIVVGKETPLYDLAKLYRVAMQEAAVPNKMGAALAEIAASLDFDSQGYEDFSRWVHGQNGSLSTQFEAALYLFQHGGADQEVRDRIVRFWSGDRIGVAELRRWLKDIGEAASYKVDKTPARELALQRYYFVPRLAIAAGYSGWVLFIDEVELVARYSLRQRARSYAEIARWLGGLAGFSVPGLTCVLTVAGAFESVIFDEKKDDERIPNKLRAIGRESDELLASQAEMGMRLFLQNKLPLERPSPDVIRQTFDKLRSTYASAYGWAPPSDYIEPDPTARMRQHVKRWITEWDLMRLYPDYKPDIETSQLGPSYTEMPELEASSEDSPDQSELAEPLG